MCKEKCNRTYKFITVTSGSFRVEHRHVFIGAYNEYQQLTAHLPANITTVEKILNLKSFTNHLITQPQQSITGFLRTPEHSATLTEFESVTEEHDTTSSLTIESAQAYNYSDRELNYAHVLDNMDNSDFAPAGTRTINADVKTVLVYIDRDNGRFVTPTKRDYTRREQFTHD